MPFKPTATRTPNWGLYLDRPQIDVNPRALIDGHNFRIKNGTLSNLNLGWVAFDVPQLNGPVVLIDNFFPRDQDEKLIFGTLTDLYVYTEADGSVDYLTPTYVTGTASSSGTTVTGVGTSWLTNVQENDEISFGSNGVTDPDADWFLITNIGGDTTLTISPTSGVVGSGNYTIRRKFSGNLQDNWSFDVFIDDSVSGDDLWIATNGVDPIVSWNGTDTTVTLDSTMNFTCTTVATFSNMMIYGNLVVGGVSFPSSIINSDIGSPLLAGDAGTGLSEQFKTHGGSDGIVNMLTMGDYLVLYSERHIVPMQFVGDPLIFIFRPAITGLGPAGPNAIADFGDFHQFVGADTQYSFDGVGVTETNPQIWREVIRQADPLRKANMFGHFDEENGDLIWSIPSTEDVGAGDVDKAAEIAWVEHYLEEIDDDQYTPHSRRDFPFTITGFYERNVGLTWANAPGTWSDYNFSWNDQFFALGFPLNLAGDIEGNIWILNDDQQADGQDLASFVQFNRWPSGDGRQRNLLTRIYPFMLTIPGEINITTYGADTAFGQLTPLLTNPYDMEQAPGEFFVTPYRRARYFSIRFGTDGNPWQMAGWDRDVKKGGRR